VKPVLEELGGPESGRVTSRAVKEHIRESAAVFVALSPNVQSIQHTRDWVASESGVAVNKDVWVFERLRDRGSVFVVTPFLRHYILYETPRPFISPVRSIIKSYDDPTSCPPYSQPAWRAPRWRQRARKESARPLARRRVTC
jgi:hypothetical protein